MSHVKIQMIDHGRGTVSIDGNQIDGVTHIRFRTGAQEINRVLLVLSPAVVEFEGTGLVNGIHEPHAHIWLQHGESAKCACGRTADDWYCPKSPDHLCHYDKGDFDQCDFCGQPEERK